MSTRKDFWGAASIAVVAAWLLLRGGTCSVIHADRGRRALCGRRVGVSRVAWQRRTAATSAAYDAGDRARAKGDRTWTSSAAAFPFYDGFESGALGADWSFETTHEGRVRVGDGYAYAGTYSLLLDDYDDDYTDSIAAAILTVDLTGQSDVVLDFWGQDLGGSLDEEDGVFVSDDGGATWHLIFDLNSLPSWYRRIVIDLDEEAAAKGLTFNDHFLIKFQFYDDEPIPFDGFAIDEVRVRPTPVVTPASFPFYDGFESGALGEAWAIDFTNEGRVQVGSAYAYSGDYSLLLDDRREDNTHSIAAAILTVDLAGQSDVVLDFWGQDLGGSLDEEDGVFASDDGGATWHLIFDLNSLPSWYRRVVIDVDEEAAAKGLTLNDHFLIKFQFYDDDPIPVNGFAIDEVRVRPTPVVTPASFPFYDGFESGVLGEAWAIDFTNEGRVRVGGGYAYSGSQSLQLDDARDDSIDSIAAAILTVDLAGQSDVVLDFWGQDLGGSLDEEDGVFVSDDDGATWHEVFDLNALPSWYRRVVIDVDEEAAAKGLTLNDHFLIKFQFYDDDPIPVNGFAIDEVRVRPTPVVTPASFPFYDGFESGALGEAWAIDFTNEGRVQVGSGYAYSGTFSLQLDDAREDSIESIAAAILAVDLAGQSDAVLDFWGQDLGGSLDDEDGVFVSDDDGATWHPIFDLKDLPSSYRHIVIDLDEEAAAHGLTLSDHFLIKFQFYDDDPIPVNGFAIDEVEVRPPVAATPATVPFYDGFESGSLGDAWLIDFTNEGRVQVGGGYAYSGTYSLLLDDYDDDYTDSIAAAILTVDLTAQSDVVLDFWGQDLGGSLDEEDGVFVSDDGGATWHLIFDLKDLPSWYRRVVIDLDEEAAAKGLTFNDHFLIKFQFYDDDPIPVNGFTIDEVRVRPTPVVTPASFPFYDGFESGALGEAWGIDFTNEGRVQVGSGYAYSGTRSLQLDDARDDGIESIAAAILTVDLAGQSDVVLDFWGQDLGGSLDDEDGVFVSDDDSATWHVIFDLNDLPSVYEQVVIDLVEEANGLGLSLNDRFLVKFQFYDDDPIPTDGFAIDEIQLRRNAAPTLSWAGTLHYEQDGIHPESGGTQEAFTYAIRYADPEGDPPGVVQVHIEKGGTDIAGSPFDLTCASGDYTAGVVCSTTRHGLEAGLDYSYSFAGWDDQGNAAPLTPELDGPTVTIIYRVHLPTSLKDVGPPAGSPVLDAIDNPDGHYKYTVSWSAVERATRYLLEEDDSPSFSSPTTVYYGAKTSVQVMADEVGTTYYRVKASNSVGESDWSNTQSVEVTVAPPPCPEAGSWTGTTDEGYGIEYTVADTPECEVTNLTITVRMECVFTHRIFLYTVEYFTSEPIVDRAFEYYSSSPGHTERVGGDFTSQTEANGNSYFFIPDPQFPIPGRFCIGGAEWTANYSP